MKKEIEVKIRNWPKDKGEMLMALGTIKHKGKEYSIALDEDGLTIIDSPNRRTIILVLTEAIESILDGTG